jgi:hypothetical protein
MLQVGVFHGSQEALWDDGVGDCPSISYLIIRQTPDRRKKIGKRNKSSTRFRY